MLVGVLDGVLVGMVVGAEEGDAELVGVSNKVTEVELPPVSVNTTD